MQQQHLIGAFFGVLPSDMTCCEASGSRKRARRDRQEPSAAAPLVDMINSNVDNLPNHFRYGEPPARLTGSMTGTSSSGRPAISSLAVDLYSHVFQHSIEIDAIIRLQNERLRLLLEESRKRQWRAVVDNSKAAVKRLREKEMELDIARWKNAELEETMRQLSSENQAWFDVARNNEAIVSALKSSLDQLLLHVNAAAAPDVTEGDGDSEGGSNDAHSCCFEGDYAVRERTAARRSSSRCRVCSRNDVGVLLLPCRHLCVCRDCESKVYTCPICNGTKDACLQIFLS